MNPIARRMMTGVAIAGAMVVSNWASAFGPTFRFESALDGQAAFLYNTNVVTTTYFSTVGKITGFDTQGRAELRFDGQEPVGAVTGFWYATRYVAQGKKASTFEQLYGDVSGTSTRVGDVWTFSGTITITGGSGRLAGATGTIQFSGHQYGQIDPIFDVTPNRVPCDVTYTGTYTLP